MPRACLSVVSLVSLLSLVAIGCGGAAPPAATTTAATSATVTAATAGELEEPAGDPGTIARAELDRVLDEGLGRFLQRVSTEPHLEQGRFVGFRLTQLRDESLFTGVDLQPGDTILEVNGQEIERPEHAFTVWTALRVASELTIVVLRGEERRELRFAIRD